MCDFGRQLLSDLHSLNFPTGLFDWKIIISLDHSIVHYSTLRKDNGSFLMRPVHKSNQNRINFSITLDYFKR